MQQTAEELARAVSSQVEFGVAWVGFLGVAVGAVFGFLAALVPHVLKERSARRRDAPRKKLLLKMLEDDRFPGRWRKLATLQHVVGADAETAKQLLLEIDARASEDGQELWSLLKYHPLPGDDT